MHHLHEAPLAFDLGLATTLRLLQFRPNANTFHPAAQLGSLRLGEERRRGAALDPGDHRLPRECATAGRVRLARMADQGEAIKDHACPPTSPVIGNCRTSKSSGIGFLLDICFMKKAMPLAAHS